MRKKERKWGREMAFRRVVEGEIHAHQESTTLSQEDRDVSFLGVLCSLVVRILKSGTAIRKQCTNCNSGGDGSRGSPEDDSWADRSHKGCRCYTWETLFRYESHE